MFKEATYFSIVFIVSTMKEEALIYIPSYSFCQGVRYHYPPRASHCSLMLLTPTLNVSLILEPSPVMCETPPFAFIAS